MKNMVHNIVFAGIGGQGVLKASDILADAAFLADYDVKKSEIHGMSQRGGSVTSDVRFGEDVKSPMVPTGEADFLVVLAADQIENNRPQLKDGGVLISTDVIDESQLENKRSLNVAMLGALSTYFEISDDVWLSAIKKNLPEKVYNVNVKAFELGKAAAKGS